MNCREFVDFLFDYVEGELPEAQRATFDAHMGECPDCVTYLDTYRDTIRLGREAFSPCDEPDAAVPEEVPQGLVDAILRARTGR